MSTRAVRVWPVPVALAITSAAGLLGALVGDGIWDALSWLALGTPLALVAVLLMRTRSRRSKGAR